MGTANLIGLFSWHLAEMERSGAARPQASPQEDALSAYFVENLKTVTVWYF